jgi:hypothetical protein
MFVFQDFDVFEAIHFQVTFQDTFREGGVMPVALDVLATIEPMDGSVLYIGVSLTTLRTGLVSVQDLAAPVALVLMHLDLQDGQCAVLKVWNLDDELASWDEHPPALLKYPLGGSVREVFEEVKHHDLFGRLIGPRPRKSGKIRQLESYVRREPDLWFDEIDIQIVMTKITTASEVQPHQSLPMNSII